MRSPLGLTLLLGLLHLVSLIPFSSIATLAMDSSGTSPLHSFYPKVLPGQLYEDEDDVASHLRSLADSELGQGEMPPHPKPYPRTPFNLGSTLGFFPGYDEQKIQDYIEKHLSRNNLVDPQAYPVSNPAPDEKGKETQVSSQSEQDRILQRDRAFRLAQHFERTQIHDAQRKGKAIATSSRYDPRSNPADRDSSYPADELDSKASAVREPSLPADHGGTGAIATSTGSGLSFSDQGGGVFPLGRGTPAGGRTGRQLSRFSREATGAASQPVTEPRSRSRTRSPSPINLLKAALGKKEKMAAAIEESEVIPFRPLSIRKSLHLIRVPMPEKSNGFGEEQNLFPAEVSRWKKRVRLLNKQTWGSQMDELMLWSLRNVERNPSTTVIAYTPFGATGTQTHAANTFRRPADDPQPKVSLVKSDLQYRIEGIDRLAASLPPAMVFHADHTWAHTMNLPAYRNVPDVILNTLHPVHHLINLFRDPNAVVTLEHSQIPIQVAKENALRNLKPHRSALRKYKLQDYGTRLGVHNHFWSKFYDEDGPYLMSDPMTTNVFDIPVFSKFRETLKLH